MHGPIGRAALSARRLVLSPRAIDALLSLLVLAATAAAVFLLSAATFAQPLIVDQHDFWFESDGIRVVLNMTSPASGMRSQLHPFFTFFALPPTVALMQLASLDGLTAVRVVTAAVAGTTVAAFYVLQRLTVRPRLDALLFTAVLATSASSIFWFTVPETYAFGALGFVAALAFVAAGPARPASLAAAVAINVGTLGITLTNWMAGLLATVARCSPGTFRFWRRPVAATIRELAPTARVIVATAAVSAILWLGLRAIFPKTRAPFPYSWDDEHQYLLWPSLARLGEAAEAFFLHTMVMPEFTAHWRVQATASGMALNAQHASISGSNLWAVAALAAWIALLAYGALSLVRGTGQPEYRITLGLLTLAQAAMHFLYGEETFLYSLHYLPLLVGVAALGAEGRARLPALLLAGVLVACNLVNNLAQFDRAVAALRQTS